MTDYSTLPKQSKEEQIRFLRELKAKNENNDGVSSLWEGYGYIRGQIMNDSAWDFEIVRWLEVAAEINGPGQPFYKQFVFGMNDEAALQYEGRHISFEENQKASNELARTVFDSYIAALEQNTVLDKNDIFTVDVNSAVVGLGLKPSSWAGGPLGSILYGFDVSTIYPIGELTQRLHEWFVRADTVAGRITYDGVSSALKFAYDGLSGLIWGIDETGSPYTANVQAKSDNLYIQRVTQLPDGQVKLTDNSQSESEIIIVADRNLKATTIILQSNTGPNGARLIFTDELAAEFSRAFEELLRAGPIDFSGSNGGASSASYSGKSTGSYASGSTDGTGSGGGSPTIDAGQSRVLPTVRFVQNPDGSVLINGTKARQIAADPRSGVALVSIDAGVDASGDTVSVDAIFDGKTLRPTGGKRNGNGQIEIYAKPGEPTTIRLANRPQTGIDFVDAGEAIGSVFGHYLAGNNVLTDVVATAALTTIGSNLGDVLNSVAFGSDEQITSNIGKAFDGIDKEFLTNLESAGIGAVSSFLTAQLIGTLGVDGLAGQALNSAAGLTLNTILTNIVHGASTAQEIFKGVNNIKNLTSLAASFVGNQLASAIANWDEVGEQLGASIGGSLGASVGTALLPGLGTAVGAFLGNLIGGFIGGLFTGKPESGAIVGYDANADRFAVASVWKKDGGNKTAARQLGESAANSLNGILSAIGGDLLNGGSVDAGSYGLRGKSFTYWKNDTSSDNRVSFDDPQGLVAYGVLLAARGMKIVGGDVFVKRAFNNTLSSETLQTGGLGALLGNLTVAERLQVYLRSSTTINALIAAEPNSVFAADWILALTQASELGLLKRSTHDWDGGFSYLLSKGDTAARDVQFRFETLGDPRNGKRAMYLDGSLLRDTVDSDAKTIIEGDRSDDILNAAVGGIRSGLALNNPKHIANVFHGGSGNDRISGGDSGDDIFGEEGDDRLIGGALDDWIFGGDGNDLIVSGGGSGNVLSGGSGDDVLIGASGVSADVFNSGSDWLAGGDGDDRLTGQGGDDYLEGGAGNDRLDGGEGGDTYIYRTGDGHDLLSDSGLLSAADHDVLEFGKDIRSTDVTALASSGGGRLALAIGKNANDTVELRGAAFSRDIGIEEISFVDSVWSRGDITSRAVLGKTSGSIIVGTASNETLKGTVSDDTLTGGGGTDVIAGGRGSDTYLFGLGDGSITIDDTGLDSDLDVIAFGPGISVADIRVERNASSADALVIRVGSGGDTIFLPRSRVADGSASIEEFRFANGTSLTLRDIINLGVSGPTTDGGDTFLGFDRSDFLYGGDGNDVLDGGRGNDNLEGQAGADTYRYSLGGGDDRIYDIGHYNSPTAGDRLVLGAGITKGNLRFEHDLSDGNALRISFAGVPGSVVIESQFVGNDNHGVETIVLADGTTFDRAAIIAKILADSISDGNDVIDADHAANVISGGGGDDRIAAWSGDDTLIGGRGNDNLEGAAGSDTYYYSQGDGADRIYDLGDYNAPTAGDLLVFGSGITTEMLGLEREWIDARNLKINIGPAGNSILIDDEFDSSYAGIDSFVFDDGTVWDHSAMAAAVLAQNSTQLGDRIIGYHGNDVIDGGAGDDRIAAWAGDDIIRGGAGDDDIQGGQGADTYVYALGDGNDRIFDLGDYNADTAGDRLVFSAGIAVGDIVLERDHADGNSLRVRFSTGGGSILLERQFVNANGGVETFEFADGTVWNTAQIIAQTIAQSVSELADWVEGSNAGDTITAGAGDDYVYGWSGDDVITGGGGDDNLEGGQGADTYVYNAGDGNDRIFDLGDYNASTPNDTLVLGAGISAGDLLLTRDTADSRNLIIRFGNVSGSILIDDQFNDGNAGIDRVEFADGTVWDRSAITAATASGSLNTLIGSEQANVLTGTAGGDLLRGNGGNDLLVGGAGNDRLEGGSGDDVYIFNRGDGADSAYDESGGTDVLRFGATISPQDVAVSRRRADFDGYGVVFSIAGTTDELYFQNFDYRDYGVDRDVERVEFADGTVWTFADIASRLQAKATDGDDVLAATSYGNDVIDGGSGDDRITGSNGVNTLIGGTGNDRIDGGVGNETYLFARGDGMDTISDRGGNDTLRFGAGISTSDIRVERRAAGDNMGIVFVIAGSGGQRDSVYVIGANFNSYGTNQTIEHVAFADGTVWTDADVRARLAADAMTAGDDYILGSTFSGDMLSGGAGDDQLTSFDGNDTLNGGTGQDLLEGGTGNDTYVFARGDGRDVVREDGGEDVLRLGAGIGVDDIVVTRRNGDGDSYGTVLSIRGTGDEIYIVGADFPHYGVDQDIERIEFADGTVWTDADIRARMLAQAATGGDDVISASGFGGDVLSGLGGDDLLYGNGGNDTLEGGAGNDRVEGGDGDDTYIFGRGDGRDVVSDNGGGSDILSFGLGITEADIKVERRLAGVDANSVVFLITGTTDSVSVLGWDNRDYGAELDLEKVVFATGEVWTPDVVRQLLQGTVIGGSFVTVTMGDDTINGSNGADTLRGMKGDDVLRGGMGSDTYLFRRGDGYDTIYDAKDAHANDRLILEGIDSTSVTAFVSPTDPDDVVLYVDDGNVVYLDQQVAGGGSGIEEVQFADGVVWTRSHLQALATAGGATAGADKLLGTNFADTLTGGLGDDLLEGRGGGDTYRYSIGDGNDVIDESTGIVVKTGAETNDGDRILFGSGISFSDLRLASAADGDLLLTIAGQSGSIRLKGQEAGGTGGVETLAFADGSSAVFSALRTAAISRTVTDGDDRVIGFALNDMMRGGLGNDTLEGGAGSDTYTFALGDGSDIIVEAGSGGLNVLAFAAGIGSDDLRLTRRADNPADLVLLFANGTDQVVIRDQFGAGSSGIQQITFADGTMWDRDKIIERMAAQPATAGDDFLVGSDVADTMDGLAGADTVYGGAGADVLFGGAGDDHLYGGVGADTIAGGDGDDVISGDEGSDILDGGAGFDTVDYEFSLDRWSIDLSTGTAAIIGSPQSAVETIANFEAATGGLGGDTIVGSAAANTIRGGAGDDKVAGGAGDDLFLVDGTDDGVDTIDGGTGFDRIEALSDETQIGIASLTSVERISAAGHVGVTIAGTDEDDALDLSSVQLIGITRVLLGAGDDLVESSTADDAFDLGDGNDIVRFGAAAGGADTIDGGQGVDRIEAREDDAVIRLAGYTGIETISGAGFAGVVLARTDAAEVTDLATAAFDGITRYDLLGGDDGFVGSNDADTVRGGAGDDALRGLGGDDVFEYVGIDTGRDGVDGGAGYDRLTATEDGTRIGIRSIIGIEAITSGGHNDVTVALTDGDDILDLAGVTMTGIAGIAGGQGNDTLRGSEGDDVFLVGGTADGVDEVDGRGGTDRIQATATDTVVGLRGLRGVERIDADGFANVSVRFTQADDSIDLTEVALTGIASIDLGAGNDVLQGSSGADTIVGGTGNDASFGGQGDDVYVFNIGDGRDTISDQSDRQTGGGFDCVRFGEGIDPEDVEVTTTNDGRDFVLTIGTTGDAITITNGASASQNFWIEEIRFANGVVWTRDHLSGATLPYSNGDDVITGTDGIDALRGGGGDDTIYAQGGDDEIRGDTGNDALFGRGGNDVIDGGEGNDVLGGDAGDDVYRFGRGDGQDMIYEWSGQGGSGGFDTVEFKAGVAASDVAVRRGNGGKDLILTIAGTADSITLGETNWRDYNHVEQVRFADGTIWDQAELARRSESTESLNVVTRTQIVGDGNYNELYGTADNDLIDGKGQGDYLEGRQGSDVYVHASGDGGDRINDVGSTNDTDILKLTDLNAVDVSFRRDGSHLYMREIATGQESRIDNQFYSDATYGVEQIQFADGTALDRVGIQQAAWIRGNGSYNDLFGSDLADTFEANGGGDYMAGGNGSDVYRYTAGDGGVRVNEAGSVNDTDVLRLTNLNATDVSFRRDGPHLYMRETSTGQESRIDNQFYSDSVYGVEQIQFADGTTWNRSAIQQAAWVRGNSNYNDLYGSDLADTFEANGGGDYMAGGNGSDTYRYTSGDGGVRVNEAGGANDTDILKLTDLNAADVSFRRDGSHLYMREIATGQESRIDNQFYSDATYGVEQIQFADGTALDRVGIQQAAWIRGNGSYNDLYGSDLADTFEANGGGDYMAGGNGSDVYRYTAGDGSVRVNEAGSVNDTDVLRLTNLNATDVSFRRDGPHLYMREISTGQESRIDNQFYSDSVYGVEQIQFADGITWNRSAIQQAAWVRGNSNYNDLYGSDLADTFEANGGGDYMAGGNGSDTYRYTAGDGSGRIQDRGTVADTDTLKLTNLNPEDITLRRADSHLYVRDLTTGQETRIDDQFYSDATYGIERIDFADGDTWNRAAILANIEVSGSSNSRMISPSARYARTISGGVDGGDYALTEGISYSTLFDQADISSIGVTGEETSGTLDWNSDGTLNPGISAWTDGSNRTFGDTVMSFQPGASPSGVSDAAAAASRLVQASAAFRPFAVGMMVDIANDKGFDTADGLLAFGNHVSGARQI
jgi:Ca2+-binding RTX toxin-like protein